MVSKKSRAGSRVRIPGPEYPEESLTGAYSNHAAMVALDDDIILDFFFFAPVGGEDGEYQRVRNRLIQRIVMRRDMAQRLAAALKRVTESAEAQHGDV
ncbi:MAG: DUF3467 domain-containing protein [Chloroflexi bacterium]|nr:DUF3467 domain-containing protein [Chloroflexota bacterium]